MEKGRGKRSKKAIWHLTLGLRDTIFAGVGVVGLMMMSFALGALAGRGDIYRAAYSWGLLTPEGPRVAQWSPVAVPPATTPAAAPTATKEAVPSPAPKPTTPPAAAAPAPHPAPVTGSIAPLPATSATKKKTKSGAASHEAKSREEEMRRVRQEVVPKLKFQNSFDTTPKPPKVAQKPKEKPGTAAKTQPTQVRVAQFRDSKAAQAKVAELQKTGVKASIKQSQDQKGPLYTVYKQAAANPQTDKVAEKPDKSGGTGHKSKPE